MGLVVLAPADSIIDLAVAGSKSSQGDEKGAKNGIDFADALVAAFGGKPAVKPRLGADLGLGPWPVPAPGDDRPATAEGANLPAASAALLAGMPLLQMRPVDPIQTAAAAQTGATAGEASSKVATPGSSPVETAETSLSGLGLSAATEELAVTPAESGALPAVAAEAPTEPVLLAGLPALTGGQEPALEPAPAVTGVAAPAEAAENGEAVALSTPQAVDLSEGSIPPDPLPVDIPLPAQPGQEDSVVRSVGNAQEDQDNGGHGTPQRRGEPQASAQGIAHAAARSAVGALRTEPADAQAKDPSGGPGATGGPAASPQGIAHASEQSEVVQQASTPGDTAGEGQDDSHERGLPSASTTALAHASAHSAVARLSADAPAEAPGDPVPAPPVDQPPALDQVAQTVFERVEDGGGEARIRLDPPELGEVRISVKISGDSVRVEIHAERPEAMQLLRQHAADLSSLLGGRGLDLSDVYVGLGGRQAPDPRGERASDGRQGSGHDSEFASILGIDEPAPVGQHNRLRAAYNPDGAMVYRV